MSGTTEENTYFTKLKAGGRFAIYAFGIHLAFTFTIGCLGLAIGSPLLTFPLAILISNPIVWILTGVVLTVAYKMAVEPLYNWTKDYINEKRTGQDRQKTPDRDSGIFECKDENSFVYKTENGDYKFPLSTTDIRDIARSKYKWIAYIDRKGSKDTSQGVYFTCHDESSLQGQLEKYKSQVEGKDKNLIFTSIFNLNGNHWVTLVVKPDAGGKKFRAYYCDSFGSKLPSDVRSIVEGELQREGWVLDIKSSPTVQQEDGWNCGIFALENAHTITQMLKEDKLFDDIREKLSEYKTDSKKLEEKRKEFAKALKDDISRRNSVASGNSDLGVGPKVVTHNTAGDRNCFFHAVFGDNSSGQYKAERTQEMRLEWRKFLSQFTSLDDASMPAPLKAQLEKVFNMFLNRPKDLTGKSNQIKKLAEYTNKKIKKVKRKIEKLIRKLLCIGLPENEVSSNLKEFAVSNLFSARRYDKNYNSENVANSFLNSKLIYRSYLEAISNQNYYVFIEEIPILASLAKIEIDVHYKNNGKDVHTVFKPNPEMINEDYQQDDELWGKKEKEMIYLAANHYSRAEIAETEKTQSIFEKIGSVIQGAAASVRNALG